MQARKWKQQNPEHIKEYTKNYWAANKENINQNRRGNPLILERRKKYYQEHHEEELERKRKYDEKNRELVNEKGKEYYWKNPELHRENSRAWSKENLAHKLKLNMAYYNKNYKNNELFKLKRVMRKDLFKGLKQVNEIKTNSTFKTLGYSPTDLKSHLEKQFEPEMNWKNYGTKWHIDHIKPLSWAKTKEEVIQFNKLENLQPLDAKINMQKNCYYAGKPQKKVLKEQ